MRFCQAVDWLEAEFQAHYPYPGIPHELLEQIVPNLLTQRTIDRMMRTLSPLVGNAAIARTDC